MDAKQPLRERRLDHVAHQIVSEELHVLPQLDLLILNVTKIYSRIRLVPDYHFGQQAAKGKVINSLLTIRYQLEIHEMDEWYKGQFHAL